MGLLNSVMAKSYMSLHEQDRDGFGHCQANLQRWGRGQHLPWEGHRQGQENTGIIMKRWYILLDPDSAPEQAASTVQGATSICIWTILLFILRSRSSSTPGMFLKPSTEKGECMVWKGSWGWVVLASCSCHFVWSLTVTNVIHSHETVWIPPSKQQSCWLSV